MSNCARISTGFEKSLYRLWLRRIGMIAATSLSLVCLRIAYRSKKRNFSRSRARGTIIGCVLLAAVAIITQVR